MAKPVSVGSEAPLYQHKPKHHLMGCCAYILGQPNPLDRPVRAEEVAGWAGETGEAGGGMRAQHWRQEGVQTASGVELWHWHKPNIAPGK
jgi:hypothetical protein